jgi:hypothetical protein
MHKRTDLSAGNLNGSDRLVIQLIQPIDSPPIIAVDWPSKATVCTPATYDAVAAATMKLLADASVALAALRARKRL